MTSFWDPSVHPDMRARQMASKAQEAADAAAVGLRACRLSSGKTTVVLTAGSSVDVPIVWKTPMPASGYTVEAVQGHGLIGQATLAVKSQTVAGCVIAVTATTAVPAGAVVFAHAYL